MNTDIFQSNNISYVLAWIFSIPVFLGLLGYLISMLFEKIENVPRLFTIWLLICIIVFSPLRYIFFQIMVASVYPFQSLSAFLSMFYLAIFVPIVFSILYGIGFGLPLLGAVFVAGGFGDTPSRTRLLFGSLAAPFILFLGTFLFFSIVQYAAYTTHMLKSKDLIRATNGPVQYFYKYVVEFGTPLSYPEFAYDIGLKNLTYKERLRLHVASIYMGDNEFYYYMTSDFAKYTELRNKIEKLKKTLKSKEKWAQMTTEESIELDAISAKMLEEPLDDEDLERVTNINRRYEKRVGRSITEEEYMLSTQIIELSVQYKSELGNCLLKSFDTKKPFISDKYKKYCAEMRHLRLITKSGIDADFRFIESTATGETWIDENGKEHSPLTREDILVFSKKNYMIKDNLNKFFNALKDVR